MSKGRSYPVGTVRNWKGKDYIKTGEGWKPKGKQPNSALRQTTDQLIKEEKIRPQSEVPKPQIPTVMGQKFFEGMLMDIDSYGPIEDDDKYKIEALGSIKKKLEKNGIKYIDAYHVTDMESSLEGINGSSVDSIGRASDKSREKSVYMFLDPDDIKRGYPGIMGAEADVNTIMHIKIPLDKLKDMRWDSNFNITYDTYSAARILGDVPHEWIAGMYDYSPTGAKRKPKDKTKKPLHGEEEKTNFKPLSQKNYKILKEDDSFATIQTEDGRTAVVYKKRPDIEDHIQNFIKKGDVKKSIIVKSVPKETYEHPDKLGEGAKKRKKLKSPQDKFEAVMGEFARGTLRSGSGEVVTDRKQALAIAYSESGLSKAIKGGKADNLTPADLAKKYNLSIDEMRSRLEAGIKVEMEHTNKRSIAREIAMDHLSESAEYYIELKKMESKMEKAKVVVIKAMNSLKNIVNPPAEYDRKYKLQDRIKWNGLDIGIENKKGTYRKGKDPDGKPWKTKMNYAYGRIGGSKATDNEGVDCVSPDTRILMGNYTEKLAKDIRVGDILIGSEESPVGAGSPRSQKQTVVTNVQTGVAKMLKFSLEDGTIFNTTEGHLHYCFSSNDKKWKRADNLRIGNKIAQIYKSKERGVESQSYMKGYLVGAYRGDGCVRLQSPEGKQRYCDIRKGIDGRQSIFRVAEYWNKLGLDVAEVRIVQPNQTTAPIDETGRIIQSVQDIVTLSIRGKYKIEFIKPILENHYFEDVDWCRGFLAGFYDTDGYLNNGRGVTISQVKNQQNAFADIDKALKKIGLQASRYKTSPAIRVKSDKWRGAADMASLEFVIDTCPAVDYKRNFLGISLRSTKLKIEKIESYMGEYVAIETDLRTYIANGIFTHNCYIGPNKDSDMVYVVHQNNPWNGKYDEDKSMLDFSDADSAVKAYLGQYNRPDFFGGMSEFTVDEFKQALKEKRGGMLYKSPIECKGSAMKKAIVVKKNELEVWKKKLIAALEKADMRKARGYAVGTIREWKGKKYKKLSSGKWVLTYEGKGTRGEKQAVRNVMKKIQNASSMSELAKMVSENMQRFKDENGKTLPIVKEFMAAARGTESGKKDELKKQSILDPTSTMQRPDNSKISLEDLKEILRGVKDSQGESKRLLIEMGGKNKPEFRETRRNLENKIKRDAKKIEWLEEDIKNKQPSKQGENKTIRNIADSMGEKYEDIKDIYDKYQKEHPDHKVKFSTEYIEDELKRVNGDSGEGEPDSIKKTESLASTMKQAKELNRELRANKLDTWSKAPAELYRRVKNEDGYAYSFYNQDMYNDGVFTDGKFMVTDKEFSDILFNNVKEKLDKLYKADTALGTQQAVNYKALINRAEANKKDTIQITGKAYTGGEKNSIEFENKDGRNVYIDSKYISLFNSHYGNNVEYRQKEGQHNISVYNDGKMIGFIAPLQSASGEPIEIPSLKSSIKKSITTKENGKTYTTSKESERRTPPKGYPKDTTEYLDPKNLKYPVDTEKHVRAAMSYFSANQGDYPAEQRKKMWGKLIRRAKELGIEVSEDVKKRMGKSIIIVRSR